MSTSKPFDDGKHIIYALFILLRYKVPRFQFLFTVFLMKRFIPIITANDSNSLEKCCISDNFAKMNSSKNSEGNNIKHTYIITLHRENYRYQ